MKYLFITVTVFLILQVGALLATASDDSYCEGWEKGYVAGYCYEVVNCIEPVVPVCPIPEIGFDTYQDGYNRGFTKGKEDKNE